MSFGERLKCLREEKNLTQVQLGEVLNVSDATINRYEKNLREPGHATENKIADYFGVSLDWLRGRTNIKNHDPVEETVQTVAAEMTAEYGNPPLSPQLIIP